MANEEYTYFELTAKDEYVCRAKTVCCFLIFFTFFNVYMLFIGIWNYVFLLVQCSGIILLIYFYLKIHQTKSQFKELLIDEDKIVLRDWYSRKIYKFKWYQIKKVQVKSNVYNGGWGLIVYIHDQTLQFMFLPYYWEAKPKKCIKVLENCIDVKSKLEFV